MTSAVAKLILLNHAQLTELKIKQDKTLEHNYIKRFIRCA